MSVNSGLVYSQASRQTLHIRYQQLYSEWTIFHVFHYRSARGEINPDYNFLRILVWIRRQENRSNNSVGCHIIDALVE